MTMKYVAKLFWNVYWCLEIEIFYLKGDFILHTYVSLIYNMCDYERDTDRSRDAVEKPTNWFYFPSHTQIIKCYLVFTYLVEDKVSFLNALPFFYYHST